jgi:hypothetical protein
MREWLSGGVSPCQGEGRGFESRLALKKERTYAKHRFFPFYVSEPDSYSHKPRLWKNKNGGPHADILVLPATLWSRMQSCEVMTLGGVAGEGMFAYIRIPSRAVIKNEVSVF